MTDARADGAADWEQDLSSRDGWPVAAGVLSVLALIALAVAARYIGFVGQSPFVLLGALVAAALVIWGVAYAVTLRHAGWLWSLGVLGLLLFLAVAVAVVQMIEDISAARNELAVFRAIHTEADGTLALPANADHGPISHAFNRYFSAIAAIRREETAAANRIGIAKAGSIEAARADPKQVQDCDRYARFKTQLEKNRQRGVALTVQLPKEVAALAISPVVKREIISGLRGDLAHARAILGDTYDRSDAMADEAQAMCRVLARHRWRYFQGTPLFTSINDMNEFNAHIRRWNALSQESLAADSREHAAEGNSVVSGF